MLMVYYPANTCKASFTMGHIPSEPECAGKRPQISTYTSMARPKKMAASADMVEIPVEEAVLVVTMLELGGVELPEPDEPEPDEPEPDEPEPDAVAAADELPVPLGLEAPLVAV